MCRTVSASSKHTGRRSAASRQWTTPTGSWTSLSTAARRRGRLRPPAGHNTSITPTCGRTDAPSPNGRDSKLDALMNSASPRLSRAGRRPRCVDETHALFATNKDHRKRSCATQSNQRPLREGACAFCPGHLCIAAPGGNAKGFALIGRHEVHVRPRAVAHLCPPPLVDVRISEGRVFVHDPHLVKACGFQHRCEARSVGPRRRRTRIEVHPTELRCQLAE